MDQNSDIKKVLVFCQAPADIQYVIALYEKYHKTTTLSVYCINVEAMYLFLKALNLELSELVFIPSCLVNFKNPRKLIVEKLRLNHLYQNILLSFDVRSLGHIHPSYLLSCFDTGQELFPSLA